MYIYMCVCVCVCVCIQADACSFCMMMKAPPARFSPSAHNLKLDYRTVQQTNILFSVNPTPEYKVEPGDLVPIVCLQEM